MEIPIILNRPHDRPTLKLKVARQSRAQATDPVLPDPVRAIVEQEDLLAPRKAAQVHLQDQVEVHLPLRQVAPRKAQEENKKKSPEFPLYLR